MKVKLRSRRVGPSLRRLREWVMRKPECRLCQKFRCAALLLATAIIVLASYTAYRAVDNAQAQSNNYPEYIHCDQSASGRSPDCCEACNIWFDWSVTLKILLAIALTSLVWYIICWRRPSAPRSDCVKLIQEVEAIFRENRAFATVFRSGVVIDMLQRTETAVVAKIQAFCKKLTG
jgi:hypothetical protein